MDSKGGGGRNWAAVGNFVDIGKMSNSVTMVSVF